MDKKDFIRPLLLLGVICMACSCHNEVRPLTGSYSFKTSGYVEVKDGSVITTKVLPDEIGTLDLISLNNKDSLLAVFNPVAGPVSQTQGRVANDSIVLQPYQRTVQLVYTSEKDNDFDVDLGFLDKQSNAESFIVTVESVGQVYDNTIIFNSQWTGVNLDGTKTITGTHLQTICTSYE